MIQDTTPTKKSLVLFFAGVCVGGFIVYQVAPFIESKSEGLAMQPFWDAHELLLKYHVAREDVAPQDMVYGAIHGLVSAYKDPYTQFFPPEEDKAFDEEIKGEFEGIGMEVIMENGAVTVVSPLKGSPAEQAGFLPGDLILAVDGTTTAGEAIDATVSRMRGPKGTTVSIEIYRPATGEEKNIEVTRDTITIPTLEYEQKEDGVFYVNIFNFSENVATLFAEAMQAYRAAKAPYLVIDLRNNPGGYLDAAVDIASWFVPKGEAIVIEAPVNEEEFVFRSKGYEGVAPEAIYVLVNGGSASAAEILAGALQDHKRAVVIGSQTFGKGSVQELFDLSKDTSIKVTVAKWLTPLRNWIDQKGVTPDIVVEASETETLDDAADLVLEKVFEIVHNR